MGDLENLIALARDKVSAIISKPKMAEKLLAKPPFRFLHDTVTAITAATGFANGLYNEQELDSAAITDKHAKIAYLDKIFNLVGICKGGPLDVKSLKVVQGLEPEFTNQFLIALAECATDGNLDFDEAVRRCLEGEQPGQGPPPFKKAGRGGGYPAVAESKESESRGTGRQSKPSDDNKFEEKKEVEAKFPSDLGVVAPERGKSRGGTRGGKPNQASTDTGLTGLSPMAPRLDGEIEKCDGTEATTQRLLGELITRPKLLEKLLAKPPFRFLHDIVMEVIRATGFGRGLYTEFESDSQNVTEKNQKLAFLEKIIKLVGIQLNTLVEARPNRVVAGLDPQITNNFLQLLAVAAKHIPDSTNAVRTVLEQFGDGSGAGNDAPAPTNNARPTLESKNEEVRQQPVQQSIPHYSEPKEERNNPPPKFDDRKETLPDEKLQSVDINVGDDGEVKRSTRPTTARRRPPKVKDGATELQSKDIAPAPKKTTGIIIDGARDDDDDDIPDETRLVDELKADAKNDDNLGTNQSKLVQDIKARQLEQEAAGRQQKSEPAEETKIINESSGNTGGSGIRLGKLRKTGLEKKAAGTASVSTFAEGDLEKIRASIQSLVQQTGPLGTCMDFIQEDISLMTAELHKWEEECRKYEGEYEEAKRKTKEVLHPLKVELADLEDQIMEQISKISSAKATNAKNDEKLQNLLKIMSNA